jgi:hypothetical protein
MSDVLSHIEKALADGYRKEIDQAEHIWRSLPFFATTLALQFATVSQTLTHWPTHGTGPWLDSVGCTVLIVASSSVTILLLMWSILWLQQPTTYIAPEPEILDYATALNATQSQTVSGGQLASESPLDTLKGYLAVQYANATYANRLEYKRRAALRSYAAVALLISTGATLFLLSIVLLNYDPMSK